MKSFINLIISIILGTCIPFFIGFYTLLLMQKTGKFTIDDFAIDIITFIIPLIIYSTTFYILRKNITKDSLNIYDFIIFISSILFGIYYISSQI